METLIKESDGLKPGEVRVTLPNGEQVLDQMKITDISGDYGITAIGFQYTSRITGNLVIIGPSQNRVIEYKPLEKE